MAIAFTCSECEEDLKVKDEFAGRKIKCPECGAATLVPKPKTKVASARASGKEKSNGAAAIDEQAEQEEERSRKKKKKKHKNTSRMVRILAAAGGLIIVAGIVIVVLIMNRKEEPKEKKAEPLARPATTGKEDPDKKIYSAGLPGTMDRAELRPLMATLGQAYKLCEAEKNNAPASQNELSPYFEKNQRILEMLDKRWVTFIYGVGARQLGDAAGQTIVAYQTDKDAAGIRIVVMGNGSIQELDDATFQKTKKASK